MDFFNRFNYWGRLDPDAGVYDEIEQKQIALHRHIDDFEWLYGQLADYRSKSTLHAILSNWYRYDFDAPSRTRELLFDDYFDLDLVQCSPDAVSYTHLDVYKRQARPAATGSARAARDISSRWSTTASSTAICS